jgi:hypothetical protein
MDKKYFEPKSLKEFSVDSGSLIIADPFDLGYSGTLQNYLNKIRGTDGKKFLDSSFPFTLLEFGTIYYNFSYSFPGAGEDGLFGVSKKKDSVLVQDLDYPETIEELKGKLFEASLDLCCLLIGDAKIFGQSEQIVHVPKGIYFPSFDTRKRIITIAKK